MNILFLTLSNINSIYENTIYTDMLREFINKGHNVHIVSPSERRSNKHTHIIEEDVCKILKVKVGKIQKASIFEKGFSTIMLEKNYKSAISRYLNNIKFDLILYSTPPITLVSTIEYLKARDNAKTYLLLKDIFPQNAVDLGMLSETGVKRVFYNYFRKKEKRLYELSDYIGCMSQANVDFLLQQNPEISSDIVEVCPNTVEPLTIEKDEREITEIKNKYKIPLDKTVFIYGGNLGKPQGIDFLIECLNFNATNHQAYFVIAGAGTEYTKLKNFFEREKLPNAQLFSYLPKKDYEILANSCDVGLIFLDKRFTIPNFPSRLLSYMQASMPVLAATDTNTDIGTVIEQGEFGYWCKSNDVKEFSKKIQQLCNSGLRRHMAKNSRDYLENNYTAKHSYEIIMSHFKRDEKRL